MIFFKEKFTQKKGKIVLSFKVLPIKKNKKNHTIKEAVKLQKDLKSTIKVAHMNHTPSLPKLYDRIVWKTDKI